MNILGVILAGGLSRRMEGQEKALMTLGPKPLAAHCFDQLNAQVDAVMINANGDPERFSFLNAPVTGDTVEGFAGPLAGVLTGMQWAKANTSCSHVLTAAVDTPFFPDDYAKRMVEVVTDTNAQIALATSSDRRHPVFGLWDVALANDLHDFLTDEEGRKVMLFVERYPNAMVDFPIGSYDPFFNVNTPADLEIAEKIMLENSA